MKKGVGKNKERNGGKEKRRRKGGMCIHVYVDVFVFDYSLYAHTNDTYTS